MVIGNSQRQKVKCTQKNYADVINNYDNDVIMTSQVFCEVVGIGLEENESSESESNDYSPNEPRVHRNTKHSGLVNVCVSV